VYRKPTFSISYIHFYSYHDIEVKLGVACNLFLRALRICSPEYLEEEINIIREQLGSIKYTEYILEKALNKAKRIFYVPCTENKNSFENKIKLPYLDTIKQVTKPLGKDNPFIFSYPNTLGSKVINVNKAENTKEKVGVYEIPCKGCDKSYIGYTCRNLEQRLKEHKRAIRYGQQNSALFNHVSTTNHPIDWNSSRIVYNSRCPNKNKIIESSLIEITNNINLHKGSWRPDPINKIFTNPIVAKIKFPPNSVPGVT
ncbi:MAG: GIY-YIG nuclease family protein, partial [Cyanobacteria bacterium J06649_11]